MSAFDALIALHSFSHVTPTTWNNIIEKKLCPKLIVTKVTSCYLIISIKRVLVYLLRVIMFFINFFNVPISGNVVVWASN